MDWEQVGEVGVDAGLMWLGDPCYIVGDGANYVWKGWDTFLKTLSETQANSGDRHTAQFNYKMGHAGLGVCVSTGYGDGTYPVEVKRNHEGRIAEVRIVFISEEED